MTWKTSERLSDAIISSLFLVLAYLMVGFFLMGFGILFGYLLGQIEGIRLGGIIGGILTGLVGLFWWYKVISEDVKQKRPSRKTQNEKMDALDTGLTVVLLVPAFLVQKGLSFGLGIAIGYGLGGFHGGLIGGFLLTSLSLLAEIYTFGVCKTL